MKISKLNAVELYKAKSTDLVKIKNLNLDLSQNNVICGDCKDWLPLIPDNSIDLIYIDPPFFSKKTYEIIWGNGFELRSFEDRFKGGIRYYIDWMRERLTKAHRVLSPTGSIFLHCDWRASHRLRILLEDIFDAKNFRNEIICLGDLAKRPPIRYLQMDSQTIFWFSKSAKYKSIESAMRKQTEVSFEDLRKKGSKYKKYKNGKWGYDLPKGDYSEETLKKKEKEGLAFKNSRGNWRVIKTLIKGDDCFIRDDKLGNIWSDLPRMAHLKKEKIGYKTQKPESLIKRIIECCTEEGDIVLDFFGGGGTTAKAAYELGRRFIIGDVSPVAVQVIKEERLKKRANCHDFIDCNPYLTKEEWQNINGHVFAKKVCEYMAWVENTKKSGDGGIDGWINDTKKIPVQIKNSDVNVATVRDLAGVCTKHQLKNAILVGWSFSKGCYEEVSILNKKAKIQIELKEAKTIVQPISSIDKEKWEKLYSKRVKEAKLRNNVISLPNDPNKNSKKKPIKRN